MQFEGERHTHLAPRELWPKLRDAGFLASCVPDAQILIPPTRDQAKYRVTPGFAFVRGHLDITLEITDAQEPSRVAMQLHTKGVGSSSTVDTTVTIEPVEGGSRIAWRAVVTSLGGLLKLVPSGLIRGAAQKVIDDVWNGVDAKLKE